MREFKVINKEGKEEYFKPNKIQEAIINSQYYPLKVGEDGFLYWKDPPCREEKEGING